MKTKLNRIVVILLILVLSLSPIANVKALENDYIISLSLNEKNTLIDEFVKYGVKKSTAEFLVEKYMKTGMIDSLDPNKKPIEIEEYENISIMTFEDGSIIISGLIYDENESISAVTPGNLDKSTMHWLYTGCRAFNNNILYDLEFKFDAYGDVRNSGEIRAIYDYMMRSRVGTMDFIELRKQSKNHAYLAAMYHAPYNINSGIVKLHLYVYGFDRMYTEDES